MLTVVELTKYYKKIKVLDNVSFDIGRGDIMGVLGPNGGGKSTLLNIVAAVIKPSSGKVRIKGRDIRSNPSYGRKITGYVPQSIALYEELTVRDNLIFWGGSGFLSKMNKRTTEVACLLGLDKVFSRKVSHLSGGMQRRLNLAVALTGNPELLILDEPLAGVDIKARTEISKFIRSLADNGKTILLSSHSTDVVCNLCSSFLILNGGRQMFAGTQAKAFEAVPEAAGKKIWAADNRDIGKIIGILGGWSAPGK